MFICTYIYVHCRYNQIVFKFKKKISCLFKYFRLNAYKLNHVGYFFGVLVKKNCRPLKVKISEFIFSVCRNL